MLLRKLSSDLKTQNWVAVWLDLAIVVLGIFLGLQVSQWYEGRQELAEEVLVLQRLQSEFDEIIAVARSAVQFHQDEIVALELVLRSLKNGELNPDDEDQVRSGLRTAMEYDLGPGRSGTYIEILSSGQFRLLRDQELRSALSKYDDFVSKADSLFANFQQGQRKHESVFGRHVVNGPVKEQEFEGMPTGVAFIHGEIADIDIKAMAKDDEFQFAIRRLIEYHVNYQFWHMRIGRSANQVLNQLDPKKK
jgi:hypothetical protein